MNTNLYNSYTQEEKSGRGGHSPCKLITTTKRHCYLLKHIICSKNVVSHSVGLSLNTTIRNHHIFFCMSLL